MAAEYGDCRACGSELLLCKTHDAVYCSEDGCESCEAETIQKLLAEKGN